MTNKRVSSYDPNAPLPTVGSRWVWEIDQPHARCLIEVTETFWNGEEWFVRTKALLPDSYAQTPMALSRTSHPLNDVGRFWEACTPVGGSMKGMREHRDPDSARPES